jgi:hypothetical protein
MLRLLALSLILPAAGLAQDKAYDLKLNKWKPVAGHKTQLGETLDMKMKMSVKQGEQVLQQAEQPKAHAFAGVEEVLKAGEDGSAELRWTFSKAEHLEEGKMVKYAFHSKPVRVTVKADKSREFKYDDGKAVDEEDLAGLKEAFDGSEQNSGKPKAEDVFAPKKPVKVGESWSPAVKDVAVMLGPELADSVDPVKSKTSFTLKSVESRGGAEFGKIEGGFELVLTQMGPMKLDTPMTMKMTVTMDVCIDGKLPDGVMKMTGQMKGLSSVTAEGGVKIDLDLDMKVTGDLTKSTVK